jgi:hypothetical protein
VVGQADFGCRRRHQYDGAAGLPHDVRRSPDRRERGDEIQCKHFLQFGCGRQVRRFQEDRAGTVQNAIDLPGPGLGFLEATFDRFEARRIHLVDLGLEFRCQRLKLRTSTSRKHEPGARCVQPPRHGCADATCGPDDDENWS